MDSLLIAALLIPLGGFLFLMFSSDSIGRKGAGWIGSATVFASFVCFVVLLLQSLSAGEAPLTVTVGDWLKTAGIDASFTLHLDNLAFLMAFIITGVGFLIHVYSIGYMEEDSHCPRFFAVMNLFIFSMLLLVLADNLLLLFVGWEGVGLASYLLIGFWYQHEEAPPAATKAFVVNRIGDLGLLLGIILAFYTFGTSDIQKISEMAGGMQSGNAQTLTVLTLLLFVGAIGKSAQLPLYTWLPDAMAGPTPVSALIHAATMVTAGVYLVVRMDALFLTSPFTMNVVGIVGGLTALFAAICAIGQTDLKRVLAFSTVSQLGYMFLACGVGAFYFAMFHLMTHAFMKALLFLSAGSVVHRLHDTTEMSRMGGLAKKLPVTNICFLIGVLAMSGIPPLAAFFSKDLILEAEYARGFVFLFWIGVIAAVLTAFYLMRAYCLTFLGPTRVEKGLYDHLKEAPMVMVAPVCVLAILSAVGGFFGSGFNFVPFLESFLSPIGLTDTEKELSTHFDLSWEMIVAVGGALLGLGSAAYAYNKVGLRLLDAGKLLYKAFYIDEIYDAVFVKPLKALAAFFAGIFEIDVAGGLVRGAARLVSEASKLLHPIQSGQVRSYAAWMILGAVLLTVYLAL